jgi:Flp pilus assembly protein TadG
MRCPRPNTQRRRGTIAAELVLLLPLLIGFLLGTIEMSVAFFSRQQLLLAAREGARVAAEGGSDAEVQATVQRVLGTGAIGNAHVTITRTAEDPNNPNGRDRVQVCLSIPTTTVVPNLLPWLIDFCGESLVACVTENVE